MEIAISRMLRAGVSLAAFVVLVGGILYLWQAHGVETGLSSIFTEFPVLPTGSRRSSTAFATLTVAASSAWAFCF